MSWFSALADWFSTSAKRRTSFGRARSSQRTELEALKATLVSEQLTLADDIERTREALEARLQEVAGRLHEFGDDEGQDELQSLERVQDSLRLALRRLEASARTTQELKQEFKEWEDRGERARAEIIRSELAVRSSARESLPSSPLPSFVSESVEDPDTEQLVRAIREATREAERWHAVPQDEHDDNLLDQFHHVRDLHALLKQIDREQGTGRDRVALAVQMRDIH